MSSTVFKSIRGSRIFITNNVSQLTLGNTNTTTISATAPSAPRTYTLPETGANSSFVMTDLAQTINGIKTFSSAIPITATTNQLVLGTTNTTTITSPAPAASRVYTIPDAGASSSFIMSNSAQTIAGIKTFSSGIPITATTNQLVLGTTNTTTITSPAPSASRTYTIPDTGANSSFVMTDLTQTINGAKSFSSLLQITAVTNQLRLGGVTNITINAPAPSASRTYTLPDTGANSNFIMSDLAQTINGVKTFSSGIPITATTNQLVLGTTNTTTISATAPSASRVYTLPDAGANSSFVMTDSNQTINGVKLFSSSPIVEVSGGATVTWRATGQQGYQWFSVSDADGFNCYNISTATSIFRLKNTLTAGQMLATDISNFVVSAGFTSSDVVLITGNQTIGGVKTFSSGSTILRAPAATSSILQLNGNNTDPATTGYQLYVPSANDKITIASKTTSADLIDFNDTSVNTKKPVDITNTNANLRTWLQNTAVATGAGTANIGRISFSATMTMIIEVKVYSIDSGGNSTMFISTYEVKNNAGTVTYSLLFTTADYDQTITPAVAASIFYLTITRSASLTKNVVTYINVLNTSSSSFSIPDTVT
jgi:hypothetical protein